MQRADQTRPWWKRRHAQRLTRWRQEFNNTTELDPYPDPGMPIMSVDDNLLAIRNAAHNIRLIYFLPWVVGLWLCLIWIYGDISPGKTETNYASHRIEIINGGGRSVDSNEYRLHLSMLGEEGRVTWSNYVEAIMKYGDESEKKYLIQQLIILSVLAFVTILFTSLLLRFPRLADIYFDRQRGIVYTWRFGKIAACRFENLGFREDKIGLTLFLYGENKKHNGGYWPALFGLQPTGKAHMNNEADNTFLMAQLFAFMDKGKNSVITGNRFYRPPPRTYLYQDKKPNDFESRLAAILEREHELPELYAKHTF